MRIPITPALAIIVLTSLMGCVATRSHVNSALPYQVQQNIRTAANKEVAFEFIPAAGYDEVNVNFSGARTSFPFNGPMQSLYHELIESKFAWIDSNSSNYIRVEMHNIQHEVIGIKYLIGATARVTTMYNGESNERDFSYTQTMEAEDRGGQYSISYQLPSDQLQDFMIKFIVATDRFIDANFNIR